MQTNLDERTTHVVADVSADISKCKETLKQKLLEKPNEFFFIEWKWISTAIQQGSIPNSHKFLSLDYLLDLDENEKAPPHPEGSRTDRENPKIRKYTKKIEFSSDSGLPLCHHGKPSLLSKVNRPGSTFGKLFYTCSFRKSCKFFIWADQVQIRKAENSQEGDKFENQIHSTTANHPSSQQFAPTKQYEHQNTEIQVKDDSKTSKHDHSNLSQVFLTKHSSLTAHEMSLKEVTSSIGFFDQIQKQMPALISPTQSPNRTPPHQTYSNDDTEEMDLQPQPKKQKLNEETNKIEIPFPISPVISPSSSQQHSQSQQQATTTNQTTTPNPTTEATVEIFTPTSVILPLLSGTLPNDLMTNQRPFSSSDESQTADYKLEAMLKESPKSLPLSSKMTANQVNFT